MKSPKQAMRDSFGHDSAQELEVMLNRAVSQIDESERNYESALGDLSTRLDVLSEQAASARGAGSGEAPLQQLESQVSSLNEQIQRADRSLHGESGNEILHEMERRIAALAADPNTATGPDAGARVAQPAPPAGGHISASGHEAKLDDRFRTVSDDLERSLRTAAPARQVEAAANETELISQSLTSLAKPPNLETLVERLRAIEGFLSRAEEQHSRIAAIESHLLELRGATRASGSQMEDIARRSAREAAELVQAQAPTMNAADRLDAIQAELRMLNERAMQMDERTVGTLETMNGTLKTLADKIGGSVPSAASGRGDAGTGTSAPDHRHYQRLPQAAPAPRGQSESPLGREHLEAAAAAGEGTVGNDDFVASARRAAEAAARQPAGEGATSASGSLPRPQPPRPSITTAADAGASKKPRPLLLIAAIILLVVSAALFYKRLVVRGADPGIDGPSQLVPGDGPSNRLPDPPKSSEPAAPRDPAPATDGDTPTQPAAPQNHAPAQRGDSSAQPAAPQNRAPAADGEEAPEPAAPRDSGPEPEEGSPAQPDNPGDTSGVMPAPRLGANLAAPRANPVLNAARVPHQLIAAENLPAARFRVVERAGPMDVNQSPAEQPGAVTSVPKIAKPTPAPMPPEAIGSDALRKAAAKGDARAQFEVAARFARGDGVGRDFAAAARWYLRAASQGFVPAQYRLAALYERGHGLRRDLGQARLWYRRAAEAGNVKAMHNLAVIHTRRIGKNADYATAAQWFAKAAERGISDSQFNLGILYENGLGLRKDLKQAYKWFLLAAKAGDGEAKKRAKGLALRILPEDKVKIERSAAAWTATTAVAGANTAPAPAKAWKRASAPKAAPPQPDPVVARTQALLNELGYDAGAPDGLLGPKTRAAIEAFQESVGLDRTGRASDELITQLEMRTG